MVTGKCTNIERLDNFCQLNCQTGVKYEREILGVRQRPQDLFRASFNLW